MRFPLLEPSMSTADTDESGTKYGKAILIDFRTRTVYRPKNRSECIRQTRLMEPFGPVNLTEEW